MARRKRKPVSTKQLNLGVQKMIEGKTHREIAILGGGLLEGMLYDLLREIIVDSPLQNAESLFEYPKPLSSFGNMLSLAFAFGAISVTEFHLINVIKKIRNHAAHSIDVDDGEEFDFSTEPVRGMLFEFYPRIARNALPQAERDKMGRTFDGMIAYDPKLMYRLIFCIAEVSLMARQAVARRLEPASEINEGIRAEETVHQTPETTLRRVRKKHKRRPR